LCKSRWSSEQFLSKYLCGALWHSTHPERFLGILRDGAILPEPNIPDAERWKTGGGKEYYPYVRVIGGVCLFDFNGFDPDTYQKSYPVSTWREFVPIRKDWGASVWIEIERDAVASGLVGPRELLEKWRGEKAYKHTIMPMIEAAFVGRLVKDHFKRALFVFEDGDPDDLQLENFNHDTYGRLLTRWRESRRSRGAGM
jgi:hypothetical protein